jgi:hypothetical protein
MPFLYVSKCGRYVRRIVLAVMVSMTAGVLISHAAPQAVSIGSDGRLIYDRDEHGNQIPDFSNCGYAGADRAIPDVPVQVAISPGESDDGTNIQAAIDRVSKLPIGADGFRGAVLLAPGDFQVGGQIRINASGVVLRGSGAGDGGTTLVATGTDRRTLIQIEGVAGSKSPPISTSRRVIDEYVPVGSRTLRVDSIGDLKVGSRIMVIRPSTAEWITSIGADAFGVGWKPGTRDIRWDRVVMAIDGNTITLDAPITTAIEKLFGGATVEPLEWTGRISNIGLEDMQFKSAYDSTRPNDDEHAWHGVTVQNAENVWIRRIECRHFAGGAVALWENTKHVTVADCIALEPISELAGYRRHTFFTQGQLTLFLRCWSQEGRHDFAVGHCAAGPNAFVNCHAAETHAESGPVESWASGVLYDNVRIDGGGLHLDNRWITPPGAGWSAANCVLWQCQAATMHVSRAPTANNWAIGVWGGFSGDGTFQARSDFVRPLSLYQAQLQERRGRIAAESIGVGLVDPIGSTNPSLAEAATFSEQSERPARQLIDVIREHFRSNLQLNANVAETTKTSIRHSSASAKSPKQQLEIKDGWLIVDGRLITGGLQQQQFWRGTIRPNEAATFGPAITRFVPGRIGTGFTDDLSAVADTMLARGVAVFDHHYGLWYDRRRDDHTLVRQHNADVAPPFYEQPFARTGEGSAWNGLSKYDLLTFNPWYWRRLQDFAKLCDERGLVLFHQNYFQHNILEAGAHWADSPWRPANNVNDTGLPEPPPYIGDKRIFMAEQFYDVSEPRWRDLHRNYIRQCLDNFADCSNVVQLTSAEYSGPLEFTQFWLDTIIEWQRERGREVTVALSAPKNVQDEILADPIRAPHVDIVDIRYWCYTANGEVYAPKGGKNLAPRQHLRQTRLKPGGTTAIVQAVREYRGRFPDKAVTYYADMNCPSGRDGWAVLIGGGSLPDVRLPEELAAIVPTLRPDDSAVDGRDGWCLSDDGNHYLIYTQAFPGAIRVRLPDAPNGYRVHFVNTESGKLTGSLSVDGGETSIPARTKVLWLERIARK